MSKAPNANDLAESLRGLIGNLKRRMREQAQPGEMSWSQIGMLSRLERNGPSTVTALARAEGVRPQSMGATVRELEATGHVTGMPDPEDGRQTLWQLTPPARDLILAARAARQDWLLHAIEDNLSPKEQQHVAEALVLLERVAKP